MSTTMGEQTWSDADMTLIREMQEHITDAARTSGDPYVMGLAKVCGWLMAHTCYGTAERLSALEHERQATDQRLTVVEANMNAAMGEGRDALERSRPATGEGEGDMRPGHCKLCGAPFELRNDRSFATCDCARTRPEALEEANRRWHDGVAKHAPSPAAPAPPIASDRSRAEAERIAKEVAMASIRWDTMYKTVCVHRADGCGVVVQGQMTAETGARAYLANAIASVLAPIIAERDGARDSEEMSGGCFAMISETLVALDQKGYKGEATPPMMLNEWIRAVVGRDRAKLAQVESARDTAIRERDEARADNAELFKQGEVDRKARATAESALAAERGRVGELENALRLARDFVVRFAAHQIACDPIRPCVRCTVLADLSKAISAPAPGVSTEGPLAGATEPPGEH